MPETNTENTQQETQQANEGQQQQTESIKFDEWLNSQDETVKGAYAEHTAGLLNTVKATRKERDELSSQIKKLASEAEKGSALEKSLGELSSKLDAAEKRATFAEEAIRPDVNCSNPKVAFALATAEDLFDRKGYPDWDAIKKVAPELFEKKANPRTHAGNGTESPASGAGTMNDFIRRTTGRK